MSSTRVPAIVIQGARTNNLKNISLEIPHHQFIVVTGISGSGKSSLVFEVMVKEGQRRYFETLPSFSRQFAGKLKRPDVDEIEGLSPVIAIGQRSTGMHARATVGTMSDLYDWLRLLFARTGTTDRDISLSRSLFSFNAERGKCKRCNGIGKEEQIDLNRLIVFPEKSIREGGLAPTLPNGYIMYSQVTIEVLNQVCEAEGFSVDIPWRELTAQQREVILYGSDKIKVPFGKHSLESRLKWTGIKAKPREEGHYKGMIPIMSTILKRDRNANILKYVHAITCPECEGTRLNEDALSVRIQGKTIAEIAALELGRLKEWLKSSSWEGVANEIIEKITTQVDVLVDLGLGHLTLDRPANSLRTSEIQRIRVGNQLVSPLSDVFYVFDEPSIGLHQEENERLIAYFKQLVKEGNTVVVVEHDLATIKSADHIIEIGPAAGKKGGELIFNGSFSAFIQEHELREISPTFSAIHDVAKKTRPALKKAANPFCLMGCSERNLKNIDVEFQLGQLNVVSGKSGTGKSSLVKDTLLQAVRQQLGIEMTESVKLTGHAHLDKIDKLIFIDHSPIGKTPRSNPATYLGIADHLRDLYASLPASKAKGFTKSRFSFNNKGGRCETCQGAGKTQIGMHFLGNVDLRCGTCNGDRFNEETLQIKYKDLSIAECYQLSVNEAVSFFEGQKKIGAGLRVLQEIGLGYLRLGQSSTTLSGGEAQRIKMANQLQKKDTGNTLYIIIEPSIGLHPTDIHLLLQLFDRITEQGNTIVCIEQDESMIRASDWHIELGPKGGAAGGKVLHQGRPKAYQLPSLPTIKQEDKKPTFINQIRLNGVTTHGLKAVDVSIPKNQLTVVTGVSGSGKSSLVYDTLFAEANARFTESLSTYHRSFLKQENAAELASFSGLGPAIGIRRKGGATSKRSTVGTLSGVYDSFRLLYSRIAQQEGKQYTAQHFSFNHHLGACPTCEGLGLQRKCDPDQLIVATDQSIWKGAISKNKAIAYYADINGQFMATLKEIAKQKQWNLSLPWQELEEEVKQAVLYGTGDIMWEVTWEFSTKSRTGIQKLTAKWLGFCHYIDDEYQRKRQNKNIKVLEELLHDAVCPSCKGSRLKSELLQIDFLGKNIHELAQLSMEDCLKLLEQAEDQTNETILAISQAVIPSVKAALQTIVELGLGYLQLNRSVRTLSGGERQRVTLSGQLSTHLFGVTYVLDEPTIGLDEAQVKVLVSVLRKIIANGNTVVVIEHDPTFIRQADYLVEMGPGAGRLGGEIVYQGKVAALHQVKETLTYQLLHHQQAILVNLPNTKGKVFSLKGACANNLKNVDIDFYSGQLIAITGVSGSGKSSLMKEVLYQSFVKKRPINCSSLKGFTQFEEVLLIDQEALRQGRLSTVASYTGILEDLKTLFSKTESAKALKLKKADFSYLSKKGKCPTCNGYGKLKVALDFMSDTWLTCDSCKGARYHEVVLTCQLKGYSIDKILRMTVQESLDFFDSESIIEKLEVLKRVGVGHLALGQAGNTLSGGEAQRLKLATAIMKPRKGATLYLFDEPSTGLHTVDILQLIAVFQTLLERGDTILFIEHHRTLIEAAHQIIQLGPSSGEKGGSLMGI